MIDIYISNIKFEINEAVLEELPEFLITKCMNDKFSKSDLKFDENEKLFEKYVMPYLNKIDNIEFNELETYDDLKREFELFTEVNNIFKFFCLQPIEFPIIDKYNPNYILKLIKHFINIFDIYVYVNDRISYFDDTFPHYYYKTEKNKEDSRTDLESYIFPDTEITCNYIPIFSEEDSRTDLESYIFPDTEITCNYIPIFSEEMKKFIVSYFESNNMICETITHKFDKTKIINDHYLNLNFPKKLNTIKHILQMLNIKNASCDEITTIILMDIFKIKVIHGDNIYKYNIHDDIYTNLTTDLSYKREYYEIYDLKKGDFHCDKNINEEDLKKLIDLKNKLYRIRKIDKQKFSYYVNNSYSMDFLIIRKK